MSKFIIRRNDGTVTQYFYSAEEAGIFMWGRDSRRWNIFVELPILSCDVTAIQKDLEEAWEFLNT